MNVTDGIAAALLFWTAAATMCRAEMLRKRLDPRPDLERRTYAGNGPMIVALDLAAAGMVGFAIEIWALNPQLGIGALSCIAGMATGATAVLASMVGHNWREASRRRERRAQADGVQDMKTAVAETLPEVLPGALSDAMPPVIKALSAAPDPYEPK